MTPLHTTFALIIIVVCVLLVVGCLGEQPVAGNMKEKVSVQTNQKIALITNESENLTISTTIPSTTFVIPVFPREPVALPKNFLLNQSMGAFEDSFIGSYKCSNLSETYETNYTFISGSDGEKKVHLDLLSTSNSTDILNATIEPSDFVTKPNYAYTLKVSVTIGPNVTGEYGNNGNVYWGRDPAYSFFLKESVNGVDAPNLSENLNVIKMCSYHSQTRDMQAIPGFGNFPSDIKIGGGENKQIPLSFRNFGGGIRELQFKIPARLKGPGYVFPYEVNRSQLLPLPEGIQFSFVPPSVIGGNFKSYTDILIIETRSDVAPGVYYFPLEICYRDLDLDNIGSAFFPFSDTLWCPSGGSFKVTVV